MIKCLPRVYHRAHFKQKLLIIVLCSAGFVLQMVPTHAQSPITSSGLNTQVSGPIALGTQTQYNITGGTTPGGGPNLFHSFGNFNVPTNNIANFFTETGLPTSNILGRVTDGNISNIFELRAAAGRVYLLAELTAGRRHLVALEGAPLPNRVCWLAEVSPKSRGLAVDEHVQPPVIWIGNGDGPGSLLRLTDGGTQAGATQTVGGRTGQALIWPGAIAAGPVGRFYAHDEARQVLVATDIQGGNRREIPMRLVRSLLADPFRDRLLVSAAGKALAFDRELRPLPLKLTDSDGKSSKAWLSAFGGQFVGCEPDGSILVRCGHGQDQR